MRKQNKSFSVINNAEGRPSSAIRNNGKFPY